MSRDLDGFLSGIRATLKEWKQSQLLEVLQDAQETTKLNDYIQMTGLSYYMIKEYLDSNGTSKLDPVLNPLVKAIGDLSTVTDEERMGIDTYLFRDLVEYPFTYDTNLINSFETKNVLNTNIVPNK